MDIKLKPCPFCGGEAMIMHYAKSSTEFSQVRCKRCGAETPAEAKSFSYSSDEYAAENWNRRANNE